MYQYEFKICEDLTPKEQYEKFYVWLTEEIFSALGKPYIILLSAEIASLFECSRTFCFGLGADPAKKDQINLVGTFFDIPFYKTAALPMNEMLIFAEGNWARIIWREFAHEEIRDDLSGLYGLDSPGSLHGCFSFS